MADRSNLWGPSVRKWMMEWHSPVAGYTLGRARGGSGFLVPGNARLTDTSQPRVVDVSLTYRITD